MKKSILHTAVFIITTVLISGITVKESPADDKVKETFLKGFVIDESGNKVTQGFIGIFCKANTSCGLELVEYVAIQSNGSFNAKFSLPPGLSKGIHTASCDFDLDKAVIEPPLEDEDNVKVAAYPYDLDLDKIKILEPHVSDVVIAAYPYDLNLDNTGVIFEPVEVEMNQFIHEEGKDEIEVIIRIKRNNLEEIIPKNRNGSAVTLDRKEVLTESTRVKLNQNYPNPFNPSTLISFNLPESENVTLQVYNLSGKLISTLINDKHLPAGNRHVQFNADNLPSGVYIYKLAAGNQTLTHKMMLLK